MSQQFFTPAIQPYRKYFVFRGRAKRSEFWIFLLTALILFQLSEVVGNAMLGPRPEHSSHARLWLMTPDIIIDSAKFDDENRFRQHYRGGKHWHNNDNQQTAPQDEGTSLLELPNNGALRSSESCDAVLDASDLPISDMTGPRVDLYCIESGDGEYRLIVLAYRARVLQETVDGLLVLFLLIPFLALLSRRLHDCDRTSLWLLLLAIPGINLLLMLYCGFAEGKKSDIKYGVSRI